MSENQRIRAAIREILPRLRLMYRDVREGWECPEIGAELNLYRRSLNFAMKTNPRDDRKLWHEAKSLETVLVPYLTE